MPLANAIVPLVLLVALILSTALLGLAVSGHFPMQAGKTSGPRASLLIGSLVIAVVCLIVGIAAALRFVPWYAAIIGGGFALLASPLVLRIFPDRFVDGRGAVLTFSTVSVVLTLIQLWLVIGIRCCALSPS
jgi:hypothetical protein